MPSTHRPPHSSSSLKSQRKKVRPAPPSPPTTFPTFPSLLHLPSSLDQGLRNLHFLIALSFSLASIFLVSFRTASSASLKMLSETIAVPDQTFGLSGDHDHDHGRDVDNEGEQEAETEGETEYVQSIIDQDDPMEGVNTTQEQDPPLSPKAHQQVAPTPHPTPIAPPPSAPRSASHHRSVSESSGIKRTSFGSPHVIPTTYTPSTPSAVGETSGELDQRHPTPYSSTPFRPLNTSSEDSVFTPIRGANTSLDSVHTFASNTSTPLEINLGPQPPSFVQRRNNPSAHPDTPIKQLQLVPLPRAAITIIPDIPASTYTAPQEATPVPASQPALRVSQWRLEQIKRFRPPRPIAGARERPISVLHGPLSLPYARNPSGVDAIASDQTAYLGHVFGLRAAPSPPSIKVAPASITPTARTASDSSGTQSSRVVSSGSNSSTEPTSQNNKSGSSEGSSFVSDGGTVYKRPTIVRDYNQTIGIKKGVNGDDQVEAAIKAPVDHAEDSTLDAARPSSGVRAHLGIGKPRHSLSPIPGSPAERADSAPITEQGTTSTTLDNAIHSTGGGKWHVDPALFKAVAIMTESGGSVYPASVISTQARTSSGESAQDSSGTGHSGKADSSVNWRAKAGSGAGKEGRQASPYTTRTPRQRGDTLTSNNESPVLTVDGLFEKFASSGKTDQLASPSDPKQPAEDMDKDEVERGASVKGGKRDGLASVITAVQPDKQPEPTPGSKGQLTKPLGEAEHNVPTNTPPKLRKPPKASGTITTANSSTTTATTPALTSSTSRSTAQASASNKSPKSIKSVRSLSTSNRPKGPPTGPPAKSSSAPKVDKTAVTVVNKVAESSSPHVRSKKGDKLEPAEGATQTPTAIKTTAAGSSQVAPRAKGTPGVGKLLKRPGSGKSSRLPRIQPTSPKEASEASPTVPTDKLIDI